MQQRLDQSGVILVHTLTEATVENAAADPVPVEFDLVQPVVAARRR